METPDPQQISVLEDTSRIRVVKATPGSGKTWLVAKEIQNQISNWGSRAGGIAALSFTNVGGAESRKAVGH